jgi:branched-chain amino acid transport system ATP-binding protein
LSIENVSVARGPRNVVHDVTIAVPHGEVTTLLGPNGAGKSSLVLAVGGVLRPAGGKVRLGERDLTGSRPERIRQAGVAVVPEGRRVLSELTVEDNLRVATFSLAPSAARAGRDYTRTLFPELEKRLDVPAHALSGGEQQMLALAQALVSQPRFVLIDELSLGLAPLIVQRLIPTVRTVAESGVGVLLIEQFAAVALGLASHVYVIDRGRIRFSGSASELRSAPELLHSAYLPTAHS